MRAFVFLCALGVLTACRPDDDALVQGLSTDNDCKADVELVASAPEKPESDGAIEVSGTTRARDGVTVRSMYVGSVPVPLTEFNYRAWSVRVPPDRVAANTRDGLATLPVVAFTSVGCASLSPPLRVRVGDGAGGAGGGGGTSGTGGEGGIGGAAP